MIVATTGFHELFANTKIWRTILKTLLNLDNALRYWSNWRPGTAAVVDANSVVCYSELDSAASAIAEWLRVEIEPRLTDNLLISVRSGSTAGVVAGWLGILRAGFTIDVGNSSSTYAEIKGGIPGERDGLRWAVSSDADVPSASRILLVDSVSEVVAVNSNGTKGSPVLRDLRRSFGVFSTSGSSTGKAKEVLRNDYSVLAESFQWILELNLSVDSALFVLYPIEYTGSAVLAFATLLAGGCVCAEMSFSRLQKARNQCSLDRSVIALSPVALRKYVKRADSQRGWFDVAVLTGEPVDEYTMCLAISGLSKMVLAVWGTTEGLGCVIGPYADLDDVSMWGRPFFCEEIYCVTETGARTQGGVIGRLAGSVDTSSTVYEGRDLASSMPDNSHFLVSEDLGVLREDGRIYVLGRVEDAVVFGSIRHPQSIAEIEGFIRKELGQVESCVTPRPSASAEREVVLFTTSQPLAKARCRIEEYLSSSNLKLVAVEVLASLPRTRFGKVSRFELRQRAGGS